MLDMLSGKTRKHGTQRLLRISAQLAYEALPRRAQAP
jgi:hypothetical protein